MREVVPDHPVPTSPSSRWHPACEEPQTERELEIDLGDFRIWRGVHYSRQIESFLDDDSGGVVRVVMWRYLSAAH
jgi:hypothetical protein